MALSLKAFPPVGTPRFSRTVYARVRTLRSASYAENSAAIFLGRFGKGDSFENKRKSNKAASSAILILFFQFLKLDKPYVGECRI
jgi:hypothetical protein